MSNRLRALTRMRKFLSTEQRKYLSEAYIMAAFKHYPFIWIFCSKGANRQINKIHRHTLHQIYEVKDASVEDLL